jgi:hypothetical protein
VVLNLQVLLPESCQLGYLMVNNQNLIPSKDKNFTLCHQIQAGYDANLSNGCRGCSISESTLLCAQGALYPRPYTIMVPEYGGTNT